MNVSVILVISIAASVFAINGYPTDGLWSDHNSEQEGASSSHSFNLFTQQPSDQHNDAAVDVSHNVNLDRNHDDLLISNEYDHVFNVLQQAAESKEYEEPILHNEHRDKAPSYTPVVILTNDITANAADMPQNVADDIDFQFANALSVVGKHKSDVVDLSEDSTFNAIGQFEGRLICTGTFIAPRTVLTAAHCINPGLGTGGSKPPSKFHRQKSCGLGEGIVHNVARTILFREWMNTGDNADDVALIIVEEASDDVIEFGSLSDDSIGNLQENKSGSEVSVSVLGYSPDINADGCMLNSPGFILDTTEYLLYHDCDTAAGMNGGPIYDAKSGKIRGVHAYGFDGNSERQLNAGVAITKTLESIIRELINNYEGN